MTNGEKLKEIFPYLKSDKTDLVKVLNIDNLKSWWNAEYKEPTTKNDLGVDAVSRKELLKIYEDRFSELQKLKHLKDNKGAEDRQMGVNYCINILKELPSVTPQEPRKDEVILTKEEYGELVSSEFDNGYAKGYREALEQEPILDKLRAEIEDLDRHYDNDYFSSNKDAMFKCDEVMQIIDKYKGESEKNNAV